MQNSGNATNNIKVENQENILPEKENTLKLTDSEAKSCIEIYLKAANAGSTAERLMALGIFSESDFGTLNSNGVLVRNQNWTYYEDGTKIVTDMKYSEFESKLYKYITKEIADTLMSFKGNELVYNSDGMFTYTPGGWSGSAVNITSLTLTSNTDTTYKYEVNCSRMLMPEGTREFTMEVEFTKVDNTFKISKVVSNEY